MIIREQKKTITMIEQNHHAHLSAEIIKNWQDIFFKNDDTQLPYSFIDLLVLTKTVVYTQGVDKVEEVDAYAAALCSTHYMRFMENNTRPEVQTYMAHEKKRTKRILTDLAIDQATF